MEKKQITVKISNQMISTDEQWDQIYNEIRERLSDLGIEICFERHNIPFCKRVWTTDTGHTIDSVLDTAMSVINAHSGKRITLWFAYDANETVYGFGSTKKEATEMAAEYSDDSDELNYEKFWTTQNWDHYDPQHHHVYINEGGIMYT